MISYFLHCNQKRQRRQSQISSLFCDSVLSGRIHWYWQVESSKWNQNKLNGKYKFQNSRHKDIPTSMYISLLWKSISNFNSSNVSTKKNYRNIYFAIMCCTFRAYSSGVFFSSSLGLYTGKNSISQFVWVLVRVNHSVFNLTEF